MVSTCSVPLPCHSRGWEVGAAGSSFWETLVINTLKTEDTERLLALRFYCHKLKQHLMAGEDNAHHNQKTRRSTENGSTGRRCVPSRSHNTFSQCSKSAIHSSSHPHPHCRRNTDTTKSPARPCYPLSPAPDVLKEKETE